MSIQYVIQWRSKSNGRVGRGSKTFTREEAEALAVELNQDYPEIEHLVVEAPPPGTPQAPSEQPTVADTNQTVVVE